MNKERWSKYWYVVLIVLVVIAAGVEYAYWPRNVNRLNLTNDATSAAQNISTSTGSELSPSSSTCSTSTSSDGTMVLPNASVPQGWKETKTFSPSTVDFAPITTPTGNQDPAIEVSINKYKDSAEESLNYSGKYSSFTETQTWNVINGYIILGSSYPGFVSYSVLVRNGNCPDYTYSFDLSYYWTNGTMGLAPGPVNPDDVKILQSIVKDFTESLPNNSQ
jgi:hypothetical protein